MVAGREVQVLPDGGGKNASLPVAGVPFWLEAIEPDYVPMEQTDIQII